MARPLIGDITKPHLRKKLKMVPMRDEKGNIIPWNPEIIHGGPWTPKHGIEVNEQNATKTRRR